MNEKTLHTVQPPPDLYYQHSSHAWIHTHNNDGSENILRLVEPYRLTCESCGDEWKVRPPDAMWDERRVPEVLERIQPTADPLRWRCPERTPGDGRIHATVAATNLHTKCRLCGSSSHDRFDAEGMDIPFAEHKAIPRCGIQSNRQGNPKRDSQSYPRIPHPEVSQ